MSFTLCLINDMRAPAADYIFRPLIRRDGRAGLACELLSRTRLAAAAASRNDELHVRRFSALQTVFLSRHLGITLSSRSYRLC